MFSSKCFVKFKSPKMTQCRSKNLVQLDRLCLIKDGCVENDTDFAHSSQKRFR